MNEELKGCCIRCISFKKSIKKGYGYCTGNIQAFKEKTGKNFRAGAPEGPSFEVRKLDGCSYWSPAW
jgi:hypothetical protein